MVSHRKSVAFKGLLKGNDHEAECTITAVEVRLPGSNEVAYAQFSVHAVHKKLPPGVYELHANGNVQKVRLTSEGFWIAA